MEAREDEVTEIEGAHADAVPCVAQDLPLVKATVMRKKIKKISKHFNKTQFDWLYNELFKIKSFIFSENLIFQLLYSR